MNGLGDVIVETMMEYKRTYIDGYNLLHKISRLERLMKSNADAARRGLVEFVRKRVRGKGHVVLVFDGHGEVIGAGSSISVVFSLTRTADDWIRHNLEQDQHPRMTMVVSSDNEVRAHAVACGAAVRSAQEFIRDEKREKPDLAEMQLKNRALSERE
ncbi:MAG: NYN domain-containing protein, partial [Bacteroidota bacterium]